MLAGTGTNLALWEIVFYPVLSLLIAAAIAATPAFLAWRKAKAQRQTHDDRVKATCDAVLGLPADPNVGRLQRTPGLKDVVVDIQAAIGARNGKSIMAHINEIEKKLEERK